MTDESMDRVTIRVPQQLLERAEALVDAGDFTNRSQVIRASLLELFALYDWDRETPNRKRRTHITEQHRARAAASRIRTRAMLDILTKSGEPGSVIIIDEAGHLEGDPDFENVVRVNTAAEFLNATRRQKQ